tara:strand:- start:81 stop:473 length:393 start_codon:yes stop_codon:yes gene_type:complete
MKKEFKVFGNTMENNSIIFGTFLIIWGVAVTLLSNSQSLTSLIPTIFGIPITILSFFAKKFIDKKKLLMHIVVLIGIFVFLGGLDFFRGLINGNIFNNIWASSSKFMMLVSGFVFTFLCIKSFIFNQKNR